MRDYAAIAARAVEVIGSADPAQHQTAFDVMVAETETRAKTENYETERAVPARLGVSTGDALLAKIEAAVPARVQRLIQSGDGINLADPETVGLVAALVAGGALTQQEADDLLASNTETVLSWPGLKPGHVLNALEGVV